MMRHLLKTLGSTLAPSFLAALGGCLLLIAPGPAAADGADSRPATLLGPIDLRAGPGLHTAVISRVRADANVRVLESYGPWRRVALPADTGWVRVDELRLSTRPEDYRHRETPSFAARPSRSSRQSETRSVIRSDRSAPDRGESWDERQLTSGPLLHLSEAHRPGLEAPAVGDEWMLQVRTSTRERPEALAFSHAVLEPHGSVRLVAQTGDWYLIRDRDGRGGWVQRGLIESGLP